MNESTELKQGDKKQSGQFIKGTLILTAAGMVVKLIGFLNWIILSRVLSGEGIGLYQMAFPVYLLALSVSSAGIPVAISIITAEKLAIGDYRGARRVFYLSLAVLTVTGLFFSILLYFGAGFLIEERVIRDERAYYSLIALSPAIFFVTILSSFRGYLQGWKIMTPTAISQIVEQIFRVAAMLIFAAMLLPYGLDWAAGGASLGAGVGGAAGLAVLVYYYWKLRKDFRSKLSASGDVPTESDSRIIKRLLKLALPVSLSSIMLPVVSNLDLFIVPIRLEAAGYTVAQATALFGYLTGMAVPLVNLATIFTASLATNIVPSVSEAYSVANYKGIAQRTENAMRISNLVTIPGAVGLWLLAEPIAGLVYHAPQAGEAVRVLAISVYLLGVHQVTTGVLQGMGRTAIPVINMGISALVKVALNWVLTAMPSLGIQGAAWATVADIGVAAVLNLYYVRRYTNYKMDLKDLGKNIAAALVMGTTIYITYYVVLDMLGSNTIATVVSMALAGVVYGVVLVLIGGVNEKDIGQIPLIGSFLMRLIRFTGLLRGDQLK